MLNDPNLGNKIGFGMATTAFSAIDMVGYYLTGSEKNEDRYNAVNSSQYFGFHINDQLLYKFFRCGVMHQLLLTTIGIDINPNKGLVYDKTISGQHIKHVNAYFLYLETLNGLQKFIRYLESLADSDYVIFEDRHTMRKDKDNKEFKKYFP